jgi:hypothetical protein
MPNDPFWRYMPSEQYDKVKAKREAAIPQAPVILPSVAQQTHKIAHADLGQESPYGAQSPTLPSWVQPTSAQPITQSPLPTWAMTQPPQQSQVVAPPLLAQAAPAQTLQSASPSWVTRSALPTTQPTVGLPDQTLVPPTVQPTVPISNQPWFARGQQEDSNAWKTTPSPTIQPYDKSQGLLQNVGRMWQEGTKILGTGLSQLTDPVLGLIDRMFTDGQLGEQDRAAFEMAYQSLDKSIDPNIRASMAREMLPNSAKQVLLKAVDWTTQNFAKQ